jgi:hypothetical protein
MPEQSVHTSYGVESGVQKGLQFPRFWITQLSELALDYAHSPP